MPTHKCEECGTYWDDERQRGCPNGHRSRPSKNDLAAGGNDAAILEELRGILDQEFYQSDKLARIHFWVKWFGVAWVLGLAAGLVILGVLVTGS